MGGREKGGRGLIYHRGLDMTVKERCRTESDHCRVVLGSIAAQDVSRSAHVSTGEAKSEYDARGGCRSERRSRWGMIFSRSLGARAVSSMSTRERSLVTWPTELKGSLDIANEAIRIRT